MPAEKLRVTLFSGSAYLLADQVGSDYVPYSKLDIGADGATDPILRTTGLPVSLLAGSYSTSAYQSLQLVQLQTIAANSGSAATSTSAYQSLQLVQLQALASAYASGYLNVNLVTILSDTLDSMMNSPRRPSGATDKWGAFESGATAYGAGSAQVIMSASAGKKLYVTDVTVDATNGTTAGRVILYFGNAGDTTYTKGTDKPLEIVTLVPSASSYPGIAKTYNTPVDSPAITQSLFYQCSTAMNVDVVVHGYEL